MFYPPGALFQLPPHISEVHMRKSLVLAVGVVLSFLGLSRLADALSAACRVVAIGARWAVDAVAVPQAMKLPSESWSIVERVFSQKVAHHLSIFGRPAKSTGALCSPLLA